MFSRILLLLAGIVLIIKGGRPVRLYEHQDGRVSERHPSCYRINSGEPGDYFTGDGGFSV